MIQAAAMNNMIINKQPKPSDSMPRFFLSRYYHYYVKWPPEFHFGLVAWPTDVYAGLVNWTPELYVSLVE